jgi:ABC-type uncharacterized transport system permease subunit
MGLDKISTFCFAASYGSALLLEAILLFRIAPVLRWMGMAFGIAGLIAHTVFLAYHNLPVPTTTTAPLILSWILAIFYVYGTLHHRRVAWGVFVLPVVLCLVILARSFPEGDPRPAETKVLQAWVWIHIILFVLAGAGLAVGAVASLMYLIQAWKIKHKQLPSEGIRLLSLERLEAMIRHGINWSFVPLTGGIVIGFFLLLNSELSWFAPKVLVSAILWVVFLVVLYLRYGLHMRGRKFAIWTMVAFALLFLAFGMEVMNHMQLGGGGP